MEHIKQLQRTIQGKLARIDSSIKIISPDDQSLDPAVQAQWLINLLSSTYIKHGILKVPEQVEESIKVGDTKPWFALKDGIPVATASLIRQSDKSQEVGRAVALEQGHGFGGILMLMSAVHHLSRASSPLVAEVRVSKEFKGVPSGIATQKLCLGHMKLIPHALVPAFNHGSPDRNEQFAFSSSAQVEFAEPAIVSTDPATRRLLWSTALSLGKSLSPDTQIARVKHGNLSRANHDWAVVQEAPFSIVVPSAGHSSRSKLSGRLSQALEKAESSGTFTLIPVEMSPQMTGAVVECLNSGCVPCGVDRNPGKNGHPVLLLGRLRKGTLLTPIQLVDEVLTSSQKSSMKRIDLEFRKILHT